MQQPGDASTDATTESADVCKIKLTGFSQQSAEAVAILYGYKHWSPIAITHVIYVSRKAAIFVSAGLLCFRQHVGLHWVTEHPSGCWARPGTHRRVSIRTSSSYLAFRCELKTVLFKASFDNWHDVLPLCRHVTIRLTLYSGPGVFFFVTVSL